MQAVFEKTYELRANDFDCNHNILPSAVLDLFQSVAGQHAVILGTGFEDMIKKQLIWVLVKVKYKVVKSPKIYQTVRVKTWPLPGSKVTFQRECVIFDEQNTPLIIGSTEWVTVHSEKRRLAPAKNVYNIDEEQLFSDRLFEEKFSKVPLFKPESDGTVVCPGYCDLDINGHVNNTKYANFVLNAIEPKKQEKISIFQIDYHREIKSGMKIMLFFEKTNDGILALGKSESGETMFSAKIIWE